MVSSTPTRSTPRPSCATATATAPDGTDGTDGTDGDDVLIDVTPEPPGAHCPAGGHRVDTGVDDDGDGVLDPAEISSTAYVCDGDDGDPAIAGFQLIGRLALPTGPVAEIVGASPDGLTLAYTSGDAGDVGFADVSDPRRPIALGVVDVAGTVASGRGEPTSLAITPDGRYAVVAVKDTADPIGRADPAPWSSSRWRPARSRGRSRSGSAPTASI
jgi:hypothetical protein